MKSPLRTIGGRIIILALASGLAAFPAKLPATPRDPGTAGRPAEGGRPEAPLFSVEDMRNDFQQLRRIKDKGIRNLVLDLRGNDGGDPFCAVILYSYLENEPAPYFAEPYGKYAGLAEPVPLPQDHFNGNLYTLLDGRCGSTNGHFCALLKYHGIGRFVGTPSGSTYVCNAGKNSEVTLDRTSIILTLGRSSFAADVKGMDRSKPIMPDHPVRETYRNFLAGKDVYMETAIELIKGADRENLR